MYKLKRSISLKKLKNYPKILTSQNFVDGDKNKNKLKVDMQSNFIKYVFMSAEKLFLSFRKLYMKI